MPDRTGVWTGSNPVEPLAGAWRPWALLRGSEFRPDPPPAPDSEQMARERAEVKNYPRTNLTNLTAGFWEYYTPNHPGYPSAHSCLAGAAGGVLGRLFPRDSPAFGALAEQAGKARIMGGIHFRADLEAGLALGRQVAQAV